MSFDDELVSQFLAFTGSSDTDRAASYLEMSGGELETAVGLFMEHQGGGGGGGGGLAAGGGGGGGGSSPFGPDSGGGMDDIRAPDATRTMRLMDDVSMPSGMMFGPGSQPYNMIFGNVPPQQMMGPTAFARDVVNRAAAAASSAARDRYDMDDDFDFGDDDDDDDDDEIEVDEDRGDRGRGGGAPSSRRAADGGGSARAPSLADMFAPPDHLRCKEGGFEGARTMAKDNRRWLLVNLQSDSQFSCHALNRDVWRDELVENLVREGFIFWQDMNTSPDGVIYSQRYHVHDYPHVGIIDPRTRRLMWKKEGWTQQNPFTAEQFAEMAMDFCSRHSFDRPPQAPRPPHGSSSAAAAGATSRADAKRSMTEMSEDEALQAAMRASLSDNNVIAAESIDIDDDDDEYEMDGSDDDDDDEVVIVDPNGNEETKPKATTTMSEDVPIQPPPPPPAGSLSFFEKFASLELGDEPAIGSRIKFRMPDGKQQSRQFDPTTKVEMLYAFVAHSIPEADKGKEFILLVGYPSKDLIDDTNNTIEGCSLAGELITVRWK